MLITVHKPCKLYTKYIILDEVKAILCCSISLAALLLSSVLLDPANSFKLHEAKPTVPNLKHAKPPFTSHGKKQLRKNMEKCSSVWSVWLLRVTCSSKPLRGCSIRSLAQRFPPKIPKVHMSSDNAHLILHVLYQNEFKMYQTATHSSRFGISSLEPLSSSLSLRISGSS